MAIPTVNQLLGKFVDTTVTHTPAANTAAVATAAAPGAGVSYFIHKYMLTGDTAPAALIAVTLAYTQYDGVGGTPKTITLGIPASAFLPVSDNFINPILCEPNTSVVLTVPATGGASKVTATLFLQKVALGVAPYTGDHSGT